ncbi:MAG TPA: hypothetical protein VLF90_04355 [Patescibacteria group bacterium]|nr:hypothetical protein [Patescibacteria group bacterium]
MKYRYNIQKGVIRVKTNTKKYVVGIIASLALTAFVAVPALAAGSGQAQASPCGAVHGAFADVNGNFGWLGPDGGTPGYHGAVGQTSPATGYNNSHTDCQQ